MNIAKQKPFSFVMLFYALCFIFRGIEYMVIRTDQSFIGEALIHKLIGIILLAVAIHLLQYKWADIGISAKTLLRGTSIGLLLGCVVFTVAYGTELIIHATAGNAPSLRFYATSYTIQGNRAMESGLLIILIVLLGNIVNVVMEEGVFRGLFLKLAEEKHSFIKACLFSSLLFGLWHIAAPVRNVLDGEQSIPGAVMMGFMLVITSALLGIQYCMLYKITGSLWAGMAAHFVNNASANLLHVETASGVDDLLTIRITIAQALSFIIVFIIFLRQQKSKEISA